LINKAEFFDDGLPIKPDFLRKELELDPASFTNFLAYRNTVLPPVFTEGDYNFNISTMLSLPITTHKGLQKKTAAEVVARLEELQNQV
jgi:hypothetical protein